MKTRFEGTSGGYGLALAVADQEVGGVIEEKIVVMATIGDEPALASFATNWTATWTPPSATTAGPS